MIAPGCAGWLLGCTRGLEGMFFWILSSGCLVISAPRRIDVQSEKEEEEHHAGHQKPNHGVLKSLTKICRLVLVSLLVIIFSIADTCNQACSLICAEAGEEFKNHKDQRYPKPDPGAYKYPSVSWCNHVRESPNRTTEHDGAD